VQAVDFRVGQSFGEEHFTWFAESLETSEFDCDRVEQPARFTHSAASKFENILQADTYGIRSICLCSQQARAASSSICVPAR
jgi:hypothetical protein